MRRMRPKTVGNLTASFHSTTALQALVELDEKLHGKASMSVSRRRPVVQKCPVCGKPGGFSITSLQQHFHRAHPGTQLHTKVSIPPLL